MDKLGIKTTIYDILGYIIPGLLTIIFIYMFMYNKDIEWIISLSAIKFSSPFYILLFVIAYVSGQIVSSLSSFIFENKYVNKFFTIDYSDYNVKSNEIFGKDYIHCEKQIINSYCQNKFPEIYNTAFVFLTIYGLSRNISTCFLILDIYFIKKYGLVSFESIIIILSTILLVRNYYRFRKYYEKKIASSLNM